MTSAQFRRMLRLPFSHGGRNFLFWQLVDRGQRICHGAARLHRATLSWHKRVTMVVGTYGKTTTTRAVSAVFGLPVDHWLDANANCLGLVAWSLLRQPPWRRRLAVEAGIGAPGMMRPYVETLRPQIVVVTCVGAEHLQSFRDQDHLRSEKAEAVRALPPGGVAVLNADDPNVAWMATQTRARVIRYGFDPAWEVHVTTWEPDWPRGMRATFVVQGKTFAVRTRLIGKNSLYSLLGAVAAGLAEGIPAALAVQRLEALPPTPGRMETVPLPGGAIAVCDDYKGSIETVHAAFDALADLPAARRFIVLGGLDAPPSPQRRAYRAVADHAGRVADHVIVVGYTHREYAGGLGRAVRGEARLSGFEHAPRVADAVRVLRDKLRPGDVVLFKGQKHQHLGRILLALQGRDVRCAVDGCRLHLQSCADCPLLERSGPAGGIRKDERVIATALAPVDNADPDDGEP